MPGGLWVVSGVSLLIGVGMLGFWVAAIAGRKVPEIAEGRREIWFHIAAEVLTATALIAGGMAMVIDHAARRSVVLSSLALGMLLYTLITSPGYYVERRNPAMIAMFGGFWLLAVPAIVLRFVAM